jgi:hypothetical protein
MHLPWPLLLTTAFAPVADVVRCCGGATNATFKAADAVDPPPARTGPPPPDRCREQPGCHYEGLCSAQVAAGECRAAALGDCQQSLFCSSYGYCVLAEGLCVRTAATITAVRTHEHARVRCARTASPADCAHVGYDYEHGTAVVNAAPIRALSFYRRACRVGREAADCQAAARVATQAGCRSAFDCGELVIW